MFARLATVLAVLSTASAHIALWDKGLFGINYPYQATDSQVDWNGNSQVTPLREKDGFTTEQWFGHGFKNYPPKDGDFMTLPAGGSYKGELGCNRALTTFRNPNITQPLPYYACEGGTGIGALHVMNTYGQPADNKWFGGTALAISYTSDIANLKPNDMTVISVNYNSVWEREIYYDIPAGMPPCPPGGCLCSWNWFHQGGHGEGYPFEMYNLLYRCQITGATDSKKVVGRGTVPAECASNPDKCVKGPKTPMYIYQADGNNLPRLDDVPLYRANWGFAHGAQNDIFVGSTAPAVSSASSTTSSTSTVSASASSTVNAAPSVSASVLSATPSDKWEDVGCIVDSSARALSQLLGRTDNMTISMCIQLAKAGGYSYAGVEYGVECWASNSPTLKKAPSNECNAACPGDSTMRCGGSFRLSVWRDPSSTGPVQVSGPQPFPPANLPSGWNSLGCHVDQADRALDGGVTGSSTNTVPSCIANCASKGFKYAGVSYSQECFCGNTAKLNPASSGCDFACSGDSSSTCGGSWRVEIFSSERPASSSISPAAPSSASSSASSAASTPAVVIASSSTSTSTSSSSSSTPSSSSTIAPASTSPTSTTPSSTTPSVLSPTAGQTGIPGVPANWESLGCQADEPGARVFKAPLYLDTTKNSYQYCINWCTARNGTYAGVAFGSQCFCSVSGDDVVPKAASYGCNYLCSGDNTAACGGSRRLNLFRLNPASVASSSARPSSTSASASAPASAAGQTVYVTQTVTVTVSTCASPTPKLAKKALLNSEPVRRRPYPFSRRAMP